MDDCDLDNLYQELVLLCPVLVFVYGTSTRSQAENLSNCDPATDITLLKVPERQHLVEHASPGKFHRFLKTT